MAMEIMSAPQKQIIGKQRQTLDGFKKYIEQQLVGFDARAEVCHYTTIEALFSGILVKDAVPSKEICLRASDARYMNDPTELKVGADFMERCGKIINMKAEEFQYNASSDSVPKTYITSFSCCRDNLPMWSMYGNHATGVALCFDVSKMPEVVKKSMFRCVYYTKSIESKVEEYIKNIGVEKGLEVDSLAFVVFLLLLLFANAKDFQKILGNVLPFLNFALALKSSAYEYEKEIRLLMAEPSSSADVKYHLRNNLIVPYIEYYYPKDMLREIIVGPNTDMPRTILSLQEYLKYMGFEHVKVSPSTVPYRG